MSESQQAWSAERRRAAYALNSKFRTIATTGTNGKTTTTSMVGAIIDASGRPATVLTTVGARIGELDRPKPATLAPQSAAHFLSVIEEALERDATLLALEVTSLALARRAAELWPPDVAVFTNLTRDHLDVHPSPEAYLAAKAQLFIHLKAGGTAVLNRDDPSSALIAEVLPHGVGCVDYSLVDAAATCAAARIECRPGLTFVDLVPGPVADALGGRLTLHSTGRVHVANALAAALATLAVGIPPEAVVRGLAAFRPVAGRFQLVEGGPPHVVVDYAHTPDGLENTLATGRELLAAMSAERRGRLICVFGCGGGRDRGKRPLMGAIADRLADVIMLTSDNPRHEDPASIADETKAGAVEPRAEWHVELDRAKAIATAIAIGKAGAEAGREDIVIIAGKGHETDQIIGHERRPFSDVAEALRHLNA
jgi:UDP-N-acetylmuramoyl-L-alanyl-D-glutamate--2,6-diaminopimelate ligase